MTSSRIAFFALMILVLLVCIPGFRWRAEAGEEFVPFRQELVQKGQAVVSVEEAAYPEMFKVVDSSGKDAVVQRATDFLIVTVPAEGSVVLKTATLEWMLGVESYTQLPKQLKPGDFIGPRGDRLGKNEAKDFYIDSIHAPAGITKFFQDLLHALFYPAAEPDDW